VTEITDQFSLTEIDHHELLAILTLRYKTCWRVSEYEISFPATHDFHLKLEIHHGQIEKIFSGELLSKQELRELLEQVECDLRDEQIAEYGAEILFAHRPVTGAFRFKSIPMQILQAPAKAPRPPHASGDHPVVLEYPIRSYRTPDVRNLRRRKNAIEWTWVLNALLRGSIKYSGSRLRQMWAIKHLESDPFWAQEFYIVPGFQGIISHLSKQESLLPVVPTKSYFGGARARANLPIDTFFLPDDLDDLISAFVKLDGNRRRRFLRSAAAIYMAGELWNVSISSFFLACVQAIETLVDRPPAIPCPTRRKARGPGPTKLFRQFVEKYCLSSDVDQTVVQNLYDVRSALTHGRYLFQLDEAPWSLNLGASVASDHELEISRSALTLAKDGLRNWLIAN
jgi:hypothetical protein